MDSTSTGGMTTMGFLRGTLWNNIRWLVVSTDFNHSEKYEFVSWDYDIPIHSQYMEI